MGQYFYICDMDKQEFVDPANFKLDDDEIGQGRKLWEICASDIGGILAFLCRQSEGANKTGAGGDIQKDYKYAGRWANDRIVVIGDYDESDPLLYKSLHAGTYAGSDDRVWTDISVELAVEYYDFLGDDARRQAFRPDMIVPGRTKDVQEAPSP